MTFFVILLGIFIFIIWNHYSTDKDVSLNKGQLKKSKTDISQNSDIGEESLDINDLIKGYDFIATLWAYTSLEALNHHRERAPKDKLPHFVDDGGRNGIWLAYTDNEESFKPQTKEELRDIEFLKKFRTLYESNLSPDQKYRNISALFEEYHDLPSKLHASDWYLWDLIEIPGISASIGNVLYFEGYKSKKDVEKATDQELLNITGIGQGRLKQIRTYFSGKEDNVKHKTQDAAFSESKTKTHNKNIIEPIEINISRAQKIILPKIKFEPKIDSAGSDKQDWDKYNSIMAKAKYYYSIKNYQKAKEEFLKIYDWYHIDKIYYNFLIRTYHKLIDATIERKMYNETLTYYYEYFEKCPNFTIADINNYNHVATQQNKMNRDAKLSMKEFILNEEPDFLIVSDVISLNQELKKPKGLKFESSGSTSILNLKSNSDFVPRSLPHIEFDSNNISYKEFKASAGISNDTYRFRESTNQNAFLSSSRELKVHLYNWNLELLELFDASSYAESHTHLRRIDLSSDLSHFLVTIIDKAYLLDSKMNLVSCWHVPFKDGWEKRKVEGEKAENEVVKECLKILELNGRPTHDEIKLAFRKLVLRWHPDKNPNNPLAEERTRQLIQAYEFLSGEDIQSAFDDKDNELYYWVDLSHTKKFNAEGVSFEMSFTIGSGEDWIYGTGMSDDGKRIYLGCYSGKIYQLNQNGAVEKIYLIPKDTIGEKEYENPILFVTEYNERKYILTRSYFYILKDDKLIRYLRNEKGTYKWFKHGFIHQDKCQVIFFDRDGEKIGMISFKSAISQVCYKENIFLIELKTKAFTFNLIKKT